MDLVLLLFSCPEFYVFFIPYLILFVWIYYRMQRSHYKTVRGLLLIDIGFWLTFFVGLCLIGMMALVIIMFTHAERV